MQQEFNSLTAQQWRNNASVTFMPEKRPVTGYDGVVASTHALASSAGAEMMAGGGNAIDAAIATLFALAVIEPAKVGICGAGYFNIRLADGSQITIDNYSQAPGAASHDMYDPVSTQWPHYMRVKGDLNRTGVLSSGVPGSLKAWCEVLQEFGTMDLSDVMQPAIRHAEHGFRATPYHCNLVSDNATQINRFPETAKIFMPNDKAPESGDKVIQRDLADTLRRIAVQGSDYLYHGELGARIAGYSRGNGGIMSTHDLAAYQTRKTETVIGSYRGFKITGPPPPSAGGIHLIELLNILEQENMNSLGFGQPHSLHLMAEAMQLTFQSRNRYLGDPEFREIPADRLLSEFHAEEQYSRILPDVTMPPLKPPAFDESQSTSHVTTADRAGNVVSATQTINGAFGSKVVVPGTGVLLDNTMANFDPHPGTANSIEPFKRVASSMAPIIVSKQGKPRFALGLPGGMRIWPTVAQGIINMIDHNMTAQEAVEAPRIWTQGHEVELEVGFGQETADSLRRLGHDVAIVNSIAGGMCMVSFNEDSTITGATCWRSDAGAVALGGGNAREGVRLNVLAA